MENKIYRKNKILYYNIHLKKLFDVLYQFSLTKRSAKAVSSGLFFKAYNNSQTKRSIVLIKIMIMQNINSYNL